MKYFDHIFWKMFFGFVIIILLGLLSVSFITCHYDLVADCWP